MTRKSKAAAQPAAEPLQPIQTSAPAPEPAGPDAPQPAVAAGTPLPDDAQPAEEAFRLRFPLLAAALAAWRAAHDAPPSCLRVVSRIDGFRRAGMAHSAVAVLHDLSAFRLPEQVEALLAEPMLTVEFV
ncbi:MULTISPECIES: hypothetical protein [Phyllobacteriaceae]|jgi:hypothetical protein|uniref:Uncharacterized protein n=1 Tax=Mesorhizobium hungaricum TaxID=1566387 RepID=A0A1C2DSG2_9HYPH|nr:MULTISPECIES: hypothetical protein [Mesorhizobium]MBN9236077.1 hypothetical protein [Mesorhizobium sp.]MDQ0328037.1 hypothetical protein [Mesorhizobium sp. YL-MeA3-2017]OCX17565.1 hypothetical protein QV13_12460 [Mesorhizobium hungaricum]